MKLIIMLFFIATITQAQILTGLLTDGNYRGADVTSTLLGDSNSVFSDTTTVGDWELVGDSILVASNDSTLLAILHGGTAQLPISTTNGQDYRISFSAKDNGGYYAQPIISFNGGTEYTKTALTDSWQTYTMDFEGETVNDYYEFDGIDDYISVADDNSLDFGTSDFSIVFTIQTTYADNGCILEHGGYGGANVGYFVWFSSGIPHLWLSNGITNFFAGHTAGFTTAINNGNLNHCVWTIDRDDSVKFYLNGSKTYAYDISSYYAEDITSTRDLRLMTYASMIKYHEGTLFDLKLYSKVLPQSEITTLYNNRESTTATTVTDSLVLDLNGIDGNISSTTWIDASGEGNDGTVSGATPRYPPYFEIQLSDTAKVDIDNVVIKR